MNANRFFDTTSVFRYILIIVRKNDRNPVARVKQMSFTGRDTYVDCLLKEDR